MPILQMSLSIPTPQNNLSSSKTFSNHTHLFLSPRFAHLSLTTTPNPIVPFRTTTIRMGGGPRTYPGGVSKWQWKRMQAKKAKQLLKARLARQRQIYEMRKRAELKAAVSELERPWELVQRAPKLFSAKADEQVKVLADRFQRPGGFDMWSEKDGPQLFETVDGIPSARFFPKGVVHSIKPYGRIGDSLDEFGNLDSDLGNGSAKKMGIKKIGYNKNSKRLDDFDEFGHLVSDSDKGSGGKIGVKRIGYNKNSSRIEDNLNGFDEFGNLGSDFEEGSVRKMVVKRDGYDKNSRRIGDNFDEFRNLGFDWDNGNGGKMRVMRNNVSNKNTRRLSGESSSERFVDDNRSKKSMHSLNEGRSGKSSFGKSRKIGVGRRSGLAHSSGSNGLDSGRGGFDQEQSRRTRVMRSSGRQFSKGNGSHKSKGSNLEVYDMNLQHDGSYGFQAEKWES